MPAISVPPALMLPAWEPARTLVFAVTVRLRVSRNSTLPEGANTPREVPVMVLICVASVTVPCVVTLPRLETKLAPLSRMLPKVDMPISVLTVSPTATVPVWVSVMSPVANSTALLATVERFSGARMSMLPAVIAGLVIETMAPLASRMIVAAAFSAPVRSK